MQARVHVCSTYVCMFACVSRSPPRAEDRRTPEKNDVLWKAGDAGEIGGLSHNNKEAKPPPSLKHLVPIVPTLLAHPSSPLSYPRSVTQTLQWIKITGFKAAAPHSCIPAIPLGQLMHSLWAPSHWRSHTLPPTHFFPKLKTKQKIPHPPATPQLITRMSTK